MPCAFPLASAYQSILEHALASPDFLMADTWFHATAANPGILDTQYQPLLLVCTEK